MRRRECPGKCLPAKAVFCLTSLALVVFCSALILSAGAVRAADGLEQAPVNPKYLQWKSERDADLHAGESTVKVTAEGHRLGAIPSRIDRSYLKGTASEASFSDKASYPATYDLRDHNKITPIRDQSDCGSCWSFGSFASLESKLMPGKQTDFAESHAIDQHGFDYGPCDGGFFEMIIAYLARWGGPVPEKQYPYQYLLASSPLPATNSAAVMTPYHVQNVELVTTTTENIKSALMNSGPVAIEFYYGDTYYKASTYGYYCNSDKSINHIVAIIGWNDNYPKSKFTKTPAGNGAYLVRNSWGTSWGDKGYFWMSYYDKSIGEAGHVFNSAEATTNYNWIYQYDTLGETTDLGYGSATAWMANIFKGNPLGTTIKAVSFYAPVDSTSYTLYIYNKVTNTVNSKGSPVVKPRSGTLIRTQTGTLSAGYHTVKLDKAATVTSGKNFSVVVEVTTPSYTYPLAVEAAFTGYSSRAYAIPGQSYISSDGSTWQDITSLSGYGTANVCLKAFANK